MSQNKNSTLKNLLFSVVGVVGVLIILIAANALLAKAKVRIDLTEDKLYTLNEGTREILQNLERPVALRFYATRGDSAMPVPLRTYADKVADLLREYEEIAPDKIEVEILNPEPFSQEEDSANLDGISAQAITMQDSIYLGLAVVSGDQKTALPFLSPMQDSTLEYEITRAISSVTTSDKPLIGVISGLPVFGGPPVPPQLQQQMPQAPKWIFIEELENRFEVQQLEEDVAEIPAEINLLLLLHPSGLSDQATYAVDQFLLRGGKLAVFVDPFAFVEQMSQPQNQMMMGASPGAMSNLPKLFNAWGIDMTGEVIADRLLATLMGGRNGQPQQMATVLTMGPNNFNQDDVVTADVGELTFVFPGALAVTEVEGINSEILAESSDQSMLVDNFRAQNDPEGIMREFLPSETIMPVGVRLSGKFPTAFPDGKPAAEEAEEEPDADAETETEAETPEEPAANHLSVSQSESTVMIFSDVDFLYDAFSVQTQQLLGNRIVMPINGNLTLGLNVVDQLAGDQNLIKIRSRGNTSRPFTVIQDITAAADEKYQKTITELENKLEEANSRLAELQRGKAEGEEFILSPEQQQEIEKFQQQRVEFRQNLRELERERLQEIESLQTSLKWVNILLMPLIVIVTGVGVGIFRRSRA